MCISDLRHLGASSETEATQVVLDRKDQNDVNCWYTKATSLNNKINEVRLLVHMHQLDVFSVTETWYKESSDAIIDSYGLYQSDRKGHGEGVCIYVKNELNS